MNREISALACLAGNKHALESAGADSPLVRHLPAAQDALAAYCQGDDGAMAAALKQIPFRSPYRDLRWLLSALTCYPEDPAKGLDLLNQIPSASPFSGPAQVVAALFQPAANSQDLSPVARTFLATFRGRGNQVKPKQLFAKLLGAARATQAPELVERLRGFLAWYPQGIKAFEKTFGPLPDTEALRLQALYQERHGNPAEAFNRWVDLGQAYDLLGDTPRAAAVCRHLIDIIDKEYGGDDPELEIYLKNLVSLEPDDRQAWLRLAAFYQGRDDLVARGRCLDQALQQLPGDPRILEAAAEAAIERGANKKAVQLTRKLLTIDPINQSARARLIQAHLNHARKQLGAGKYDLARKEVESAESLAREPQEQAEILIVRGYVAQFANLLESGDQWFDQARNLLPPPLGDWLVAAEALRCRLPGKEIKPQLKQLRLILDTASLQVNKATLIRLLQSGQQLQRRGIEPTPLFQAGNTYFKKGAGLDWSLEELEQACQLLLDLERYQWVRDYLRNSPWWQQKPPSLVYFDIAAKCRGVATNLNLADVDRLERVLDQLEEDRQSQWAGKILALLEAYDQGRIAAGGVIPSSGPLAEFDAEVKAIAEETGTPPEAIMAQLMDLIMGGGNKKS